MAVMTAIRKRASALGARLLAWLEKLYELRGFDDWRKLLAVFSIGAVLLLLLIVFVSPWQVLAAMVAAGVLWAVYARPHWMIILLAGFIPFEPFLLKFVPDELYLFARFFSESLIYLLLAAVYLCQRLARVERRSTPIDLPFALFIITAATGAVANFADPSTAVLGFRQIIRFILLFFVVVEMRPSRAFVRKILILMLGIVLFQSVLGIAQSVAGGRLDPILLPSEVRVYESIQLGGGTEQFWEPGQRVFGTLGRYDQLGTFLTFFLLIAVGLAYEVKHGRRFHKYAFVLLGLGSVALTLTYSRASWFGFLGGLFVIAVLIKKDKKVFAGFLATVLLIIGYLAYSGLVVRYLTDTPRQTVVERFFEAFSYDRWRGEYFGYGRLYWFVQTPLKVVPASPIFGHGPGSYGSGASAFLGNTRVYDELGLPFGVYGTEGYIDNNWFALWGETGTLGVLLYAWMFTILWRVARRVQKRSKDPLTRGVALGFIGALLAVAFQAFLGTYLEVRTLALYFWLFAALLVASAQREKLIEA